MNESQKKQGIISVISENKGSFFLNLFIILTVTFSVLYLFDLVPNAFKMIIGRESIFESASNRVGELPITVTISSIGVDAPIYNPATTSTNVLNDFLMKGAVRYPGSGLLGGNGNVFIFGHSTGFRFVNNQAYKTFNGLEKLKKGDLIKVYSEKYEYVYKVSSVKMESADKALVQFDTYSKILTLSTCNNFGEKSDRYVVEAMFDQKNILSDN